MVSFGQLKLLDGGIVEGPTVVQEFVKDPRLLPRRVARSLIPFPPL